MEITNRLRRILQGLILSGAVLTGCNSAGAMPPQGRSEPHTFLHDGIERTYSIYLPGGIERLRPAALLVALHGGGGSDKAWPRYTGYGFERLAEREGFILVYPNGLEGHWNDGRDATLFYDRYEGVDDVGFLTRLIDELIKAYPIDEGRVYITGASNGGMMAHRLAAESSDRVAAIATVIASIPKNLEGKLHPAHPVSVLMMNGTEDPLVPWEGGEVRFGRKTRGYVLSTDQSVGFWVDRNRCGSSPTTDHLPDVDSQDGTRVTRRRYGNCESGSEVLLYEVIGGGHAWPARRDPRGLVGRILIDKLVGRKSRDIDACEIIWQFFRDHPKRRWAEK